MSTWPPPLKKMSRQSRSSSASLTHLGSTDIALPRIVGTSIEPDNARPRRVSSSNRKLRVNNPTLTPSMAQIADHDVVVEMRGFPNPPAFKIGGRQGNVVTKSSTNLVHRGWRLVAIDSKRFAAAELPSALALAQQRGRYAVTFRIGQAEAEDCVDAVLDLREAQARLAAVAEAEARRLEEETKARWLEAERLRRQREEEEQRRRLEDEEAQRRAMEHEAEAKRLLEAEQARLEAEELERQRLEVERRRKEEEEAERVRKEREEAARKQREEMERKDLERRRKEEEEAERKRREQEEAERREAEAELLRLEAERKRIEEEFEHKRREEEARQKQEEEEEHRRKEEEEKTRKHRQEVERKQREEAEELERKRQEEARAREEAEERQRKLEAEAERMRREIEERQRKQREEEEAEHQRRQALELERERREAEERERKQREAEELERKRREMEELSRRQREAEEANRKRREAEEAEQRRRELEEQKQLQAEKAQLRVQRQAVEKKLEKATGLPPREKVAEPQKALLAALAKPEKAAPVKSKGPCEKCDGPHGTDECPHFRKAREKHNDAWSHYGKKGEVGESAEQVVLRNARVVPQPGDGSCLFHSLSYGLRATTASKLRAEIADYIAANPHATVAENPIKDWVLWDTGMDTSSYSRAMRTGSQWGGAVELAVCAKVKRMHVHVYEKSRAGFVRISTFEGENGPNAGVINVLYGGRVHYDALEV